MKLIDSRRLTGPNLLWDKCGAIIDVEFAPANKQVVGLWSEYMRTLLDDIGWTNEALIVRNYLAGASLAISAPIDALYAATEINEWCWYGAVNFLLNQEYPDFQQATQTFTKIIEAEANVDMLKLQQFSIDNNVPFLCDDDELSLGFGRFSETWAVESLAGISNLDASLYQSIPVGLITGTNGKTTSTRLAAHIVQTAGLNAGISSTDWVAVNDEIIDRGDYSGPGGARCVLRDKRVDVAILETARGGLLRRGLGVKKATAALITNVAEDHMGEFGVQTLDELADVKWIVSSVLGEKDKLILNADDPLLISRASAAALDVAWFSLNPENTFIKDNISNSKWACTVDEGKVVIYTHGQKHTLLAVAKIPITLAGAASHNVENVLAVTLFAHALGVSLDDIKKGLESFSNADNPGRCNLFEINGAKVVVDFAHNPHGMNAFISVARNLAARRKLLVNGQAGDRSDEDIKQLARASIQGVQFDKIIIKLMKQYERGRQTGETANILKQEYINNGVEQAKISLVEQELDAVKQALDWSEPGDLLILLIHENRNQVLGLLTELASHAP